MSYEKYYPGGWQSGESGGTPITPEALNHIENGIKQTYSEFAPAGYGLGVAKSEVEVTDCNNAVRNGWYRTRSDSAHNPIAVAGWLRVDAYNENYLFQTFYSEYNNGRVAQRFKAQTWSEWVWIDPPMELGKEYRTWERWNGKAVYTQLIDFGFLPNNSSKSITTAIGYNHLVSLECVMHSNSGVLDFNMFNHVNVGHWVDKTTVSGSTAMRIGISTTADLSNQHAYVTAKYVKD